MKNDVKQKAMELVRDIRCEGFSYDDIERNEALLEQALNEAYAAGLAERDELIEPLIHSHQKDCLESNHPLACKDVHCDGCGVMVHCANNECMQTWFETCNGNFCIKCMPIESILRIPVVENKNLTVCPRCGGDADNGFDREIPPNAYLCTKCTERERGSQ